MRITKQIMAGASGGALGGLAMKAVVRFVDRNAFGLSAATDAKSAHDLWRKMGRGPLSESRARQIGGAMHYGFAIVSGAALGPVAARFPMVRYGRGAAFGAALWLVGAELMVSLSGLEDPRNAPRGSHFSSLGAHLLYGLVLDRFLPPRHGHTLPV